MKRFLAAIMLIVMAISLSACGGGQESTYKAANTLLTKGKYVDAAAKFEGLGRYEDASQMAMYAKALAAAESGDYNTAITTFSSLGSFKDCQQMVSYYTAKKYMENEEYTYALELFNTCPLFKDSQECIDDIEGRRYRNVENSGTDGLFKVSKQNEEYGLKWGYIDMTGKEVIPCEWDSAYSFSEGLARVAKYGKYGCLDVKYDRIDTTGKVVISCEYDSAAYSNGYFAVIKDGYLSIYDSDWNRVF